MHKKSKDKSFLKKVEKIFETVKKSGIKIFKDFRKASLKQKIVLFCILGVFSLVGVGVYSAMQQKSVKSRASEDLEIKSDCTVEAKSCDLENIAACVFDDKCIGTEDINKDGKVNKTDVTTCVLCSDKPDYCDTQDDSCDADQIEECVELVKEYDPELETDLSEIINLCENKVECSENDIDELDSCKVNDIDDDNKITSLEEYACYACQNEGEPKPNNCNNNILNCDVRQIASCVYEGECEGEEDVNDDGKVNASDISTCIDCGEAPDYCDAEDKNCEVSDINKCVKTVQKYDPESEKEISEIIDQCEKQSFCTTENAGKLEQCQNSDINDDGKLSESEKYACYACQEDEKNNNNDDEENDNENFNDKCSEEDKQCDNDSIVSCIFQGECGGNEDINDDGNVTVSDIAMCAICQNSGNEAEENEEDGNQNEEEENGEEENDDNQDDGKEEEAEEAAECLEGDANCDGKLKLSDFEYWRAEYKSKIEETPNNANQEDKKRCEEKGKILGDTNCDGKLALVDFAYWRLRYKQKIEGTGNGSQNGPTDENCVVGGCSGTICMSKEDMENGGLATTCEYKEEYKCFEKAICETQADGNCDWTETEEYKQCMDSVNNGEEENTVASEPFENPPQFKLDYAPCTGCAEYKQPLMITVDEPTEIDYEETLNYITLYKDDQMVYGWAGENIDNEAKNKINSNLIGVWDSSQKQYTNIDHDIYTLEWDYKNTEYDVDGWVPVIPEGATYFSYTNNDVLSNTGKYEYAFLMKNPQCDNGTISMDIVGPKQQGIIGQPDPEQPPEPAKNLNEIEVGIMYEKDGDYKSIRTWTGKGYGSDEKYWFKTAEQANSYATHEYSLSTDKNFIKITVKYDNIGENVVYTVYNPCVKTEDRKFNPPPAFR
jgi:eight-cysteine-cluster-containing protein